MSLDRTKAPEFHIPEDFELFDPKVYATPSGIKVYFFPTPLIEAVKIEVVSESSRGHLPLEKSLTPSFTLQLLTEGTHEMSEDEISEFFDFHATEVHPFSGFSQEGINLLTTKKHLHQVLPVFLSLFTRATFPVEKLKKKKDLRKIGLKLELEKNSSRASTLFRKALFGEHHPYGVEITEQHIEEISRQDLLDYYQTKLWNQSEIFISGDLNSTELEAILDDLRAIPNVQLAQQAEILLPKSIEGLTEERPASVQTSIRLGGFSIGKTNPDYIPLTVFNTVLGGYFGSRLIKNIREDKGHTYGIHSSLGEIDSYNYWVISADVQKDFRQEVLDEIYKEIKQLCENPMNEEETELVRNYLIGQMISKFSSSFDLMDRFKSVHFSGLDYSFYRAQLDYFRRFTSEQIQAIGNKYYAGEKFIEVQVG